MFPFPTTFLEFPAGEFYRKFSETCSRMVISQKEMFWEQKIVRKSNGADIYRLQRNVKKRDINLIALVTESTGGENIRDLRSILHWLRHGEED
ncbi:BnaC05g29790D [Brassica napus]|uniref:BnaC05g29790D protein n=2 Tax=Brassica TaxID=3705 RepID=A0A078F6Y9_BRANA|nr:BnaC05g29790D [Brassica napus]VDD45235.1 unnamed protein product [Brassica oleracea]